MDLTCYIFPGWKPNIRPASHKREWMDRSPESFAYRCLPLNIANAHGWEILSPSGFEAVWNGGSAPEDVRICVDSVGDQGNAPVALFGQGTFTVHIQALFRTEEGIDLWVGGPPNSAKDGIAPLNGIIETDWSPYTFTMNWRFTRPNHPIRFEAGEPIAFVFPVMRKLVDACEPVIKSIDDAPELKQQFEQWSRSRDQFQLEMAQSPHRSPSDKWQKFYYRGLCPNGAVGSEDHRSKLRVPEFRIDDPQLQNILTPATCPISSQKIGAESEVQAGMAARSKWASAALEELRQMKGDQGEIYRKRGITPDEFLEKHYAANWPVVLTDKLDDWGALRKWSPDYLREAIGRAPVEVQTRRNSDQDYERKMDVHRETLGFDQFMDRALDPAISNDCYLTAYNAHNNQIALASLDPDLGNVDGILQDDAKGLLWIGGAGTFTPLHHDLTNNLLLQICGRKRVVLISPEYRSRLYNYHHVYSEVRDITQPDIQKAFPLLEDVEIHDFVIEPGDALFIPLGWWHQVTSLDFSISITHTEFQWRNDFYSGYPQ